MITFAGIFRIPIKVDNPVVGGANMVNLASNTLLPINGTKPVNSGNSHMDIIQEVEMTSTGLSEEEKRGGDTNGRNSDMKGFRPASLDVLDHVKINIELQNPVSTLKGVLMNSKANMSFSKSELNKAEALMTQAFAEFYQKLRLLKSYCFLNQLAFSKIMKKYDKITSRNASKAYLEMVDNSYLSSSDEVTKLIERVEATFVKHFANGNHRKGMDTLRPKAKRERHTITFFLGSFFGCSIALIVAIIVAVHASDVLNNPGRQLYMDNIFPLYSLFGYMFLHMLMYAGNIYFWKRYRVNYSFIFGFKKGTKLGFREVLLLSPVLAVLTFSGILSNLDMEMDPRTKSFE